jgi:hypothetical protein
MNEANGKQFSEIATTWDQPLVEFHHELLAHAYPNMQHTIVNMSEWIEKHGKLPSKYYEHFFELFISNGILFENFLIDSKELKFTEEIILPAFIKVYEKTGLKPIIVALEPTEIEGDCFWMSYPVEDKQIVKDKIEVGKLASTPKEVSDRI